MISKDYEALRGLLEEFRREAAQLDAQIDDTARKIREAEAFLAVYTDSQPDDIRVFSPRKAEILYKEEIRQKEKDKLLHSLSRFLSKMSTLGTVPERDKWSLGACPRKCHLNYKL